MITNESVKEGAQPSPSPTVSVTAVRRFAYSVFQDGKWNSVWFDVGDKLDMRLEDVAKHQKANLVKKTAGRKKAVQVEENK